MFTLNVYSLFQATQVGGSGVEPLRGGTASTPPDFTNGKKAVHLSGIF